MGTQEDCDVAVVGASLAGCATAIFLARAGARVALVEKRPDPAAFKRICGHFIQSSAMATLQRLGLLQAIEEAGGLRSRVRIWTRWGWIEPDTETLPSSINLRREVLDPLVRAAAADTPGVDLMLDRTARELLRDTEDGRVSGVRIEDRQGNATQLRARLVVGADGRDSHIAELAGVHSRTSPHRRFSYTGYFEGPPPVGSPNGSIWMADPQWGAAFPTDDGSTMYAAMPTEERLPEFRRDPTAALISFVADLPEAPPILASTQVGPTIGKLEMPNVMRTPTAPGLALVGDAAFATDPLFGVGCGWAFQSAEWLADSVAAAVAGPGGTPGRESLRRGLSAYRRRHAIGLRGHAFLIHSYATGRPFNPGERLLFSAAARDAKVAGIFEAFGTRNIGPTRLVTSGLPRALVVNARHALRRRPAATIAPVRASGSVRATSVAVPAGHTHTNRESVQ
ncbi:MAG TPA: NAD(P)/FAD-dependent oxidoreductase [Solirubrobacteraceae bacterium]|jgi:2-polyprenyl-6-methoxyphenol hydroxylase-like FAD-dependent oxidoreductase